MKGEPCSLAIVPTPMGMGNHWGLRSFVLAPTAKYLGVLGFCWLSDHDPLVRWSQRLLALQEPPCRDHIWNPKWGTPPNSGVEIAPLSQEDRVRILREYHDLLWLFEEQEVDELPSHGSQTVLRT